MGMLGVYNYTVILTYLGMLFSFAGIHFVFSDIDRSFPLAILCLMIAGVMDMFDGKVASTKKNRTPSEKLFGIQIDSMADIISYGVFPALIVYKLASLNGQNSNFTQEHPVGKIVVICICALYLLCALIRLSYFNVDEMERQEKTDDCRHEYRGLPVTSIALILPFVFIVSYYSGIKTPPIIPCAFLLAVMSFAFILPFKMPKPHFWGKIFMVIIGMAEFALVICGKVYYIETKKALNEEALKTVSVETAAEAHEIETDSVLLENTEIKNDENKQ